MKRIEKCDEFQSKKLHNTRKLYFFCGDSIAYKIKDVHCPCKMNFIGLHFMNSIQCFLGTNYKIPN